MNSLKKLSLEKKAISRQDNMKEIISFKSSNLIKNVKLNRNIKPFETQKSLSKSFSSSSDSVQEEENSKKKINDINTKSIRLNLAKKKFDNMKMISTTLSSDFLRKKKNNKISNIKTIYPTIPNNKTRKKDLFKIKLKKTTLPSNYNSNSLLNKWTENINKLFTKSLKKTRKEMIQIIKRHKIHNIKKIIKIKNYPKTENNPKEENNKDTNTFNSQKSGKNKNNIEISSPSFAYMTYNRYNNYPSSDYTQSSLSSKSINKFEYNRNNNYNYNNYYNNNNNFRGYDKNYQRKINYRNYMKEESITNTNWKKKLGILNTDIKYGKDLLSDLDFQFNTIRDEINLISDMVHYFKVSLFGNEDLLNAFNNKDLYSQININKTLEETCALLSLIPKIILKDYYIYSDKFISLPEPKRELYFNKTINNETECFNDNMKMLYKVVNFLRASFEVYNQLVNQVDEEMHIIKSEFETLRTIFEKCRYYVGNLTNFVNNMLKDYNFDKKLIKKGKPILNNMKERLKDDNTSIYDIHYYNTTKKNEKKKNSTNKYYTSRKYKKEVNLNTMSNNLNLQGDEYLQKTIRIKKALDNSEIKNFTDEIRLKKLGLAVGKPMALIFSPLMSKMLKYIKKDSREKIIALRSTEKFFPIKENEEEDK